MMKQVQSYIAGLFLVFWSFTSWSQDGDWVGEFDYGDHKLRFSFTISGNEIVLKNGPERVHQEIQWSGNNFRVDLKPFDAFLEGAFADGEITGVWEKPYRSSKVEFVAIPGNVRYSSETEFLKEKKWKMTLDPGSSGQSYAVGDFGKYEGLATMNIRTEVGDYRYFEGLITNDSLIMSQFDGTHAFLVVGARDGKEWNGKIYYDPTYTETWNAVPSDEFDLTEPFEMHEISNDKTRPYFDLLAAGSGKNAIDPTEFDGQVLIIQVFGTWCPNSLDETMFLLDWYKEKPDDVELIAVTYEPNYSKEYGMKRISDYVSCLQIPYDVFLGGRMSKSEAALPFPFLQKIQAFPTLVIVDKKGEARYVHSYFNGPATGEYYDAFKKEFKNRIDLLRAE